MESTYASLEEKMKSYVTPEEYDFNYTAAERKTITELKQLYLETIKLDVSMQRDIYKMEKSYEDRQNAIYEERRKILDEFRKQNHGDSNENVKNFWLNVLKVACTELITKEDEKILIFLSDVRSKLYVEDMVKFDIDFHFDKNEYFSNKVLKKTYFFNCLPDPKDPLLFDGAEIFKCEGCTIDWKTPKSRDKNETSFFDFFSPPTLPEDTEDEHYIDIHTILNNDFEMGFYLKERVIPKAVIFFTGEIVDCQSTSDSEEDSDAEEEETSPNATG
ncbi:nucleosome assembly protein 1-like 1 [Drosophila serrata]|uniref:nucleosome assembly protein 1-like 1 n=1 Tax=Drosophila serrata TaxID=7274 RepID=UPI000A1D039C|nr:nucleosome assembly protein 1-like 1 [Drosophila serrata]